MIVGTGEGAMSLPRQIFRIFSMHRLHFRAFQRTFELIFKAGNDLSWCTSVH